jgi:hypothetical protein
MQRLLAVIAFLLLAQTSQNNLTGEDGLPGNPQASEGLKAELGEIGAIRERLGINLFKGTIFENGSKDPDAAKQFLEVYQRIAKRRPLVAQPVSKPQIDLRGNALNPNSGEPELSSALNYAGRQLDLSASRLESAGQFEEAQRLRKLAKKIRKVLPEVEAGIPAREANRRPG